MPEDSVSFFLKKHIPKFGLFGLGVWLAWEYLIERSGLWLSPSETTGQILNDINLWTPLASIATLIVIAVFQKRLNAFLHSERLPRLAALFGAITGIVLIVTGPQFLANVSIEPSGLGNSILANTIYYLMYAEFILCGITSALFVVGFGIAYCEEKSFENLFYLLINEFIIAFVVFSVDAFDFSKPLVNSPSYAIMAAVVILPIVAAWMLSLTITSKTDKDALHTTDAVHAHDIGSPENTKLDNTVQNNSTRANKSPKSNAAIVYSAEDLEHLPVRMMTKCLAVLLVFAFIGAIPRAALLSTQSPELITNNSLIVLLSRSMLSLCLIVAAIRLVKDIKIEKIMVAIMVIMPILLALSPLFSKGNDFMVIVVSVCFDELLLATWYLSCSIARHWRLSTITVFALGRIAVLAGLVLGWVFALNVMPNIYESSISTMIYCWLALIALLVLIVLFANGDAALLGALSVNTKSGIIKIFSNVRHLDSDDKRDNSDNSNRRVWHDACQEVAKAYHLTPREAEIFEYLSKGRTIETVAESLVISPNTVRTHANNLYAKCNVHSRRELIKLVEEKRADSEDTLD